MTKATTSQLHFLLILNQLPLKDRRPTLEFFDQGGSPQTLVQKILDENLWERSEKLKTILGLFDPVKEMEECARRNIQLLSILDSDYPKQLRKIYHPPIVLYVSGVFCSEDQAAIAVVGTRHPSFYGIEQARRFTKDLTEKGLTIVSGLAKGIDHVAHESALSISHGRTIGVLGCGIDQVYPPGSETLYEKIRQRGAVISEYPLGMEPLAHHFPERNRIISGLSLGVLVVEAHYRSGALITAHEAIEEGRDVFAIPGPVNQLTSRGTHRLIKEGALLVESPDEVMEVIAASILRETPTPENVEAISRTEIDLTSHQELEIFQIPVTSSQGEDEKLIELLKVKPLTAEEWIEISGLSSAKALSQLTLFELQKKIVKQTDGTFKVFH